MNNLLFRDAETSDADKLIEIYNAAFYSDFVRYGECPAYGRTHERMVRSIEKFPKYLALADGEPVGVISYEDKGADEYYIGCLCVIPQCQGREIGYNLLEFFKKKHPKWHRISLITPQNKTENILFYTKKCGFSVEKSRFEGNVEVVNMTMTSEKSI